MLKIFCLLAALLAATPCYAQTGSPQSQTQITTDINGNWADNGVGAITPHIARQTLLNLVQSAAIGITLDVNAYGAVGDGVHDDTTAINNAIAALPSAGGEVNFKQGGTYCVTSPIVIGNGSTSQQSTQQGVYLRVAGNSMNQSTQIKWCGSSNAGAMITFQGPMHGWGMSGININCNSLVNTGLHINAVQYGLVQNLRFDLCKQSLLSDTLTVAAVGSPNTAENMFNNVQIFIPDVANAVGMMLTGDGVDAVTDTNLNTFSSVDIVTLSTKTSITSIYLQGADGNVFQNITAGGGSTSCLVFDYSGGGNGGVWPSSNAFYFTDCVNQPGGSTVAKNIGSPVTGAAPNRFYGVADDNRMQMPQLANVAYPVEVWGPGADVTAQTATLSGQNLTPVITIAGSNNTFEVCGYLEVSTTGAGGATVLWSIGWTDDTGTFQTAFGNSIATSAKNYDSKCVPIRVTNGSSVFWGVSVTGTMGTAKYDFHARLKKLD